MAALEGLVLGLATSETSHRLPANRLLMPSFQAVDASSNHSDRDPSTAGEGGGRGLRHSKPSAALSLHHAPALSIWRSLRDLVDLRAQPDARRQRRVLRQLQRSGVARTSHRGAEDYIFVGSFLRGADIPRIYWFRVRRRAIQPSLILGSAD